MSLLDYVERQQNHKLNDRVAKCAVTYLLKAADYLHTFGEVHTGICLKIHRVLAFTDDFPIDIKLDNIQNTLPDEETAILKRPCPHSLQPTKC